jgi:2-dehydropantoate 2-reductase
MRLLFAGAGAVGGFLAARTLDAGHDVTVLVHPPRARQLRQAGLQLTGPGGTTVTRPHVLTAAELTDPFDVVVLAVKADVVDAAIKDIGPAIGPATVLIPFLNGMGHLGPLVDRFGPAVAGGVLRVATEAQPDSSIRVLNPLFDVEIGELDGRGSQRIEAVAAVFSAAGANVTVSQEIVREMWAKWVFIASVGAITGLMRAPIGEVVSAPDGSWFARQVVDEAAAVAAAAEYPLAAGRRQGLEGVVTDADSKLTSSLSRDLLAGRLTEVEPVLGDLAARGRAADVPVPLITASAVALRVHNRRLQAT